MNCSVDGIPRQDLLLIFFGWLKLLNGREIAGRLVDHFELANTPSGMQKLKPLKIIGIFPSFI